MRLWSQPQFIGFQKKVEFSLFGCSDKNPTSRYCRCYCVQDELTRVYPLQCILFINRKHNILSLAKQYHLELINNTEMLFGVRTEETAES